MSIYSKLSSLLTAANTKTGESDTTLTDAVQTLIDGYGGGGGGGGVQIASGSYTPASNTNNYEVSVDFEPEYAISITDMTDLDQNATWKNTLVLHDSAAGASIAVQTRYNNNAYGGNTTIYVPSPCSYSSTTKKFTFNRASNYAFLSGVTYQWFAWRASA